MMAGRRGCFTTLCALVLGGLLPGVARGDFALPTNVSDVPPEMLGGQYTPHYISIPGETPPVPPLPPSDVQAYFPPAVDDMMGAVDGLMTGDVPIVDNVVGGANGASQAIEDVAAPAPEEDTEDAPSDPPGGAIQTALTSFIGALPPAPTSASMGKYVLVLGAVGGMLLSVVGIVVRTRRGNRPSQPLASAEWTAAGRTSYPNYGSTLARDAPPV